MFRLSRMTDYAVVVMAQLTRVPGTVVTATELAEQVGLPAPTTSKVLKALVRQRLVRSQRGVAGGYVADRAADDIALTEIITAIDGPVALTACVDAAAGQCNVELICPVRGRWDKVNAAIRGALDGISLAELTAPPSFLQPDERARASA
ncbi:MAG: SUF system Fe-S cluster assembly regulator [Alphaproteobacteria bacterium]